MRQTIYNIGTRPSYTVRTDGKPQAAVSELQVGFPDGSYVGIYEVADGKRIRNIPIGGYFGAGALAVMPESDFSRFSMREPEGCQTVARLKVSWAGNALREFSARLGRLVFVDNSYVQVNPDSTATFLWGHQGMLAVQKVRGGDGVTLGGLMELIEQPKGLDLSALTALSVA